MRWFLDTEFDENGTTIKLISIALVSEAGEEYYRALSDGWDAEACNPWVRANVVPLLSACPTWATRAEAASDVKATLLRDGKPEIWGYFADYDWVVFCQLFGRMVDMPKGMPFYCRDLKQLMDERGIKKDQLPPQTGAEHDALEDARWIRRAWLWLRERG